jgi:putative phage-type endonuclease
MRDFLDSIAFNQQSQNWIDERRTYLGGTDVAAIIGEHQYESPRTLYMRKKGLIPPTLSNEAMIHGQNLERYVMQLYRAATGKRLRKAGFYRHKNIEFFGVNPDYLVLGEPGLLECKTASEFVGQEFGPTEDGIPRHYYIQCMWQLAITGREWCDLAVLIGGQRFRKYHIVRNEDNIQELQQAAYDYWMTYIDQDIMPPLTGHPADSAMVNGEFPASSVDSYMEATPEIDHLCERLRQLRMLSKKVELQADEAANLIKAEMRGCGTLDFSGGRITWRTAKNGNRPFVCRFTPEPMFMKQDSGIEAAAVA